MSFARVIGVSAVFSFTANRAIASMTRTEQKFRSMSDAANNAANSIREGFAKINTLGVIATAGVGTAVTKFADFDKAAQRLQSRLESGDPALEIFKNKAIEVGGATKFTAAEVLGAMEMFKQMGVSGTDALKNIGLVAKFAESENISLAKAVKMGVTSTKVFGMETEDLGRVMNRMMFVANNTAANTTELFNALRYVSGATKFTKSNFDEITNILGLFHNGALFGSRAGTAMTNMLTKLAKGAKDGKIQIGDYTAMIHKNAEGGLDVTQSVLNIATAFKLMQENAKKSGKGMEEVQAVADKLFGIRGSRGIGAFLSLVEGKDRKALLKLYKTSEKEVNKEIDKVYDVRVQNIKDAYIRMTSALDAFAVAAVENFKGPIYSGIEAFTHRIMGVGKVVGYITKDFSVLNLGAREVAKSLDPTGQLGISPRMVAIVQGVFEGFKGVWGVAQMLAKDAQTFYASMVDVARAVGGSEKSFGTIAGYLVGGGVLLTGLTAVKFLLGLTVMPILRIVWGMGAIVFQAAAWLGKQIALEWSLIRSNLAAQGVASSLGLAVGTASLFLLKFAAVVVAIGAVYAIVKKVDEVFLNGAMAKFGEKIGDWLSKFESLRGVLASMGLISVGGTSTAPTAKGTASQTLGTLEGMRNRGLTTVGDGKGGRRALDQSYATERVRKSLQARGYGEAEIAATLKEIAPALAKFSPPKPAANQAGGSAQSITVNMQVDGRTLASKTVQTQNDLAERNGKKVDRRGAMIGQPTPVRR